VNAVVEPSKRDRITLAIAAMGGQGGGVLADWIVSIAEHSGYFVQTTSVPGVAQRTGATIYYLELYPETPDRGAPILGLMPIPGDVDVVVAAELAEAGRAVQRGIVTPDRTTLIASSHRSYAYAEKSAMGDGRKSGETTREGIRAATKHLVCFDMQALAEAHGTVISATLFGALAGCDVLPFARENFEAAIAASGKAVDANLAAFAAAYERAAGRGVDESIVGDVGAIARGTTTGTEVAFLQRRIAEEIDAQAGPTALNGVKRMLDYQDPAYASQYLDRLGEFAQHVKSTAPAGDHTRLLEAYARHLALWMTYEDTIRVADLKIRGERFERCREEVRAGNEEIIHLTEFMHPRVEEVADTLPAGLGRRLLASEWVSGFLVRWVLHERKIHTSKIGGFLLLYGLASLRRFRRTTYRFAIEHERIAKWSARVKKLVANDHAMALEIIACQNLIKGYGDTHARGLMNFNRIMEAVDNDSGGNISAAQVRALRNAALADENGEQLREELARVA